MKGEPVLDLEPLNITIGGKKLSWLSGSKLFRSRVDGGWLVFIQDSTGINGVTFVPDSNHKWDGGSVDG